jgi:hypothetical protein
MRVLRDLSTFTGGLALVVTLGLMSPGVQISRADGATAAAHLADGLTCQASAEASTAQGDAEVGALVARVQRLQARKAAASTGPRAAGDSLVLNGNGYHYGGTTLGRPD